MQGEKIMRFAINEFNQLKLLEYGLDDRDTLLLMWFSENCNMEECNKIVIHGNIYSEINFDSILEDFPCFGETSTANIIERFNKYVSRGLLYRERQNNITYFSSTGLLYSLKYDTERDYLNEIYGLNDSYN